MYNVEDDKINNNESDDDYGVQWAEGEGEDIDISFLKEENSWNLRNSYQDLPSYTDATRNQKRPD